MMKSLREELRNNLKKDIFQRRVELVFFLKYEERHKYDNLPSVKSLIIKIKKEIKRLTEEYQLEYGGK